MKLHQIFLKLIEAVVRFSLWNNVTESRYSDELRKEVWVGDTQRGNFIPSLMS